MNNEYIMQIDEVKEIYKEAITNLKKHNSKESIDYLNNKIMRKYVNMINVHKINKYRLYNVFKIINEIVIVNDLELKLIGEFCLKTDDINIIIETLNTALENDIEDEKEINKIFNKLIK